MQTITHKEFGVSKNDFDCFTQSILNSMKNDGLDHDKLSMLTNEQRNDVVLSYAQASVNKFNRFQSAHMTRGGDEFNKSVLSLLTDMVHG